MRAGNGSRLRTFKICRFYEQLFFCPTNYKFNICTLDLQNCLGALDGTHITVHVLEIDKAKYRDRDWNITTNVLGVCTQDMLFIYILPGWEGSAVESRVLRNAISRPNGLRVFQVMSLNRRD